MDRKYPGDPLSGKNSVRLLEILPSGPAEEPIECTLVTSSIESQQPKYSALSYTWGTALHSFSQAASDGAPTDPAFEILVNGQPFLVTENLFHALKELRRSGFSDFLWIDAICIEQGNAEEKVQQVSMMGLIYRSAEQVIVWLGKDETDLEHLAWALDSFLPEIKKDPRKFIHTGLLMDTERMSKEEAVVLESKLAGAMRFISKHRWFSRTWVVQEVVLSKAVQVLCGHSVLSWKDLTTLYKVLRVTDWGKLLTKKLEIAGEKQAYFTARNAIEKFQDVREHLETYGLLASRSALEGKTHPGVVYGDANEVQIAAAWLAYLLVLVREQDCAFEQDKVYSVLGIADRFSAHIVDLVRPDYSLSANQVYEATTAQIIMHSRFLSVLGHAGDLQIQIAAKLPSWVADYSIDNTPAPLVHSVTSKEQGFDCSGARSSEPFPRSIEGSKLQLLGAPFDSVTHALDSEMGKVVGSECEIEEFVAFGGSLPLHYFNGQNPVDVLWRTILFDTGKSNEDDTWSTPAPQTCRQSFRALWITQASKWLANNVDGPGVWAPVPAIRFLGELFDLDTRIHLQTNDFKRAMIHLLATQTALKGSEDAFDMYYKEMLPFTQAYQSKIEERRLFKTQNNFVGMGPLSIQPGDQVWLIRDSLVPLVLRPVTGTSTFLLVGEAYLHGFMYGEMLNPRWEMEGKMRSVIIV